MTQPAAIAPMPDLTLHSSASLHIRACIIPRAKWEVGQAPNGAPSFRPIKGTWYGHVIRGRDRHDVTIIPLMGCPSCGGLMILVNSERVGRFFIAGGKTAPVTHLIDSKGKVTARGGGDVQCTHKGCDFHRQVYLDRWHKSKPLYAIAYVEAFGGRNLRAVDPNNPEAQGELKIDYCNAIDRKEAVFHFGTRPTCRIVEVGLAVGFFENREGKMAGKVTAD